MSGDTARSMSVRARINNLAKELGIAPQHALQRYFTERFLARIAASPYANNLVIKGGTLMSAILGVAQRTTMDIDATIIGMVETKRQCCCFIPTFRKDCEASLS